MQKTKMARILFIVVLSCLTTISIYAQGSACQYLTIAPLGKDVVVTRAESVAATDSGPARCRVTGTPAAATIQYYEQMQRVMDGRKKVEAFARLFLVPGMLHCGGGPGCHQAGPLQSQ